MSPEQADHVITLLGDIKTQAADLSAQVVMAERWVFVAVCCCLFFLVVGLRRS